MKISKNIAEETLLNLRYASEKKGPLCEKLSHRYNIAPTFIVLLHFDSKSRSVMK